MSNPDNIKKFDDFFKNSFEDFEPNLPGDAWENIDRKLPSGPNPNGKNIWMWVLVAAGLATGAFLYFNHDNSRSATTTGTATEIPADKSGTSGTASAPGQGDVSSPAEPSAITSGSDNSSGGTNDADVQVMDGNKANSNINAVQTPSAGNSKSGNSSPAGAGNIGSSSKTATVGTTPDKSTVSDPAVLNPLFPDINSSQPLVVPPPPGRNLPPPVKTAAAVSFIVSDSNACTGQQLVFKNQSAERCNKFSWDFGDNSTSAERSPRHTYTKPGTYNVVLKCIDGEEQKRFSKKIIVSEVKAVFATEITAMPVCSFTNLSTGAEKYIWEFGDGARSMESDPIYKYSGIKSAYTVKLIAINNGCRDTAVTTLRNVKENETDGKNPEIPNVFTPDGDGRNDQFEIRIEGEIYYHLVVISRDGTKLFESYDRNNQWNGDKMNSGNPSPAGTYIYLFTYQLENKPVVKARGTVQILR